MKKLKGFTLIELLVVIAIIALLLSIILPALRRVKLQSKMTICGSNMKQLVLGLINYTINNDGWFPYHPTMDPLCPDFVTRPFSN